MIPGFWINQNSVETFPEIFFALGEAAQEFFQAYQHFLFIKHTFSQQFDTRFHVRDMENSAETYGQTCAYYHTEDMKFLYPDLW